MTYSDTTAGMKGLSSCSKTASVARCKCQLASDVYGDTPLPIPVYSTIYDSYHLSLFSPISNTCLPP